MSYYHIGVLHVIFTFQGGGGNCTIVGVIVYILKLNVKNIL